MARSGANIQLIPVLLVGAGLFFLYVGLTSTGGFSGFDNVLGGNGKRVDCQATIDKDSVLSASCQPTGDTCYTTKTLGLVSGAFTADRTLVLSAVGVEFQRKEFDINFLGINKDVGFGACVPKEVTGMAVSLVNNEGGIIDQKGVTV